MNQLIEVRCPVKSCHRLIIKVNSGSSGLAMCRHCKKEFEFSIQRQNTSYAFFDNEVVNKGP